MRRDREDFSLAESASDDCRATAHRGNGVRAEGVDVLARVRCEGSDVGIGQRGFGCALEHRPTPVERRELLRGESQRLASVIRERALYVRRVAAVRTRLRTIRREADVRARGVRLSHKVGPRARAVVRAAATHPVDEVRASGRAQRLHLRLRPAARHHEEIHVGERARRHVGAEQEAHVVVRRRGDHPEQAEETRPARPRAKQEPRAHRAFRSRKGRAERRSGNQRKRTLPQCAQCLHRLGRTFHEM